VRLFEANRFLGEIIEIRRLGHGMPVAAEAFRSHLIRLEEHKVLLRYRTAILMGYEQKCKGKSAQKRHPGTPSAGSNWDDDSRLARLVPRTSVALTSTLRIRRTP
jgi:hypothetical protein